MRRGAAALLMLLVACPGIPQPTETPEVSLRAASLDGTALAAELSVLNPNHEGLVLEAVDWQLEVDDRPLARGRVELRVTIAALAAAPVSLRDMLAPGPAARLAAATSTITLSGTLHLRAARGWIAASFYGPLEGAPLTPASAAAR